jgi:hypothetical protein
MGAIAETVGQGIGEENVIGVIPKALAPREVSIERGSLYEVQSLKEGCREFEKMGDGGCFIW